MDNQIREHLAHDSPLGTMLKAAVVIPSFCDFYITPHRLSSLGAHVVASIAESQGYCVDFYDFPNFRTRKTQLGIPEAIHYIKPFIIPGETGKLSYFTKFQRFGPDPETCASVILSTKPSVILLCCFAYSYLEQAIDLTHAIKKLNTDIPIISGGAGISAYPEYFLEHAAADFCISGEAEKSLAPLLNMVKNSDFNFNCVPNLHWKQDKTFFSSPILSYTSSKEIQPAIVKVAESKSCLSYSISIARGCKKKCRFCSNFLVHGKNFRTASYESVVQILDQTIPKKSGKKIRLNFEDDNLLYDIPYLMSILEYCKSHHSSIGFLMENGIDYTLCSKELAASLIDLGLEQFNFTFATKNNSVLKMQDRTGSITHFEDIVRFIDSKSIPVLSYFICGMQSDTKRSVVETILYLSGLPTTIGISMFYAIPNLIDFKDMTIFDELSPVVCNGSSAYPWTSSLTTKELITAFRLSRFVNLVKSKEKSEIEQAMIEQILEEKRLYTFVNKNGKKEIAKVGNLDEEILEMFFSFL